MKLSGFVSILVLFGLLARVQGPSLADLLFPSKYCFFLVLSGRKGSLLEGRDKEQFLRCGSPFYSSFLGVAQERREVFISGGRMLAHRCLHHRHHLLPKPSATGKMQHMGRSVWIMAHL